MGDGKFGSRLMGVDVIGMGVGCGCWAWLHIARLRDMGNEISVYWFLFAFVP